MANLISQLSTAFGISAVVSWIWLPYGFAAVCRFWTWVSSEETVIRWSPTIAAAPALTGEHAASTAHAPTPAAPRTARRRVLLPNTGDPSRKSRILRVGEYRTDDLRAPRQQLDVTQRLTAEGSAGNTGLRHRYQHRTHRRLEQCLRV